MAIRDILAGKKLNSNISPIARMGRPVRSNYSVAADMIQTPDSRIGILGSEGNWVSGLSNALKSGLGFYGAKKDAQAEQAYYDALAQQAEQDRQDKLAQQAFENEYKTNALAQQADLAQKQIDAQAALQANQFNQQKEMEGIKNENAIALQSAATQAAIEAENRKRAYEEEQLLLKQLDPASQQAYYNLKKEGKTPIITDNRVGFIGKALGTPKYAVSDTSQQPEALPQMPDFGLSSLFNYGKQLRTLKQQPAQPKQATKSQVINGYTIVEE